MKTAQDIIGFVRLMFLLMLMFRSRLFSPLCLCLCSSDHQPLYLVNCSCLMVKVRHRFVFLVLQTNEMYLEELCRIVLKSNVIFKRIYGVQWNRNKPFTKPVWNRTA